MLLQNKSAVYRPGEEVRMRLGRITDYPIGVRRDGQLIHTGPGASASAWKTAGPIAS